MAMSTEPDFLCVRRLGIDTHQEPVIYMRRDCHVAISEGFTAQSRICVTTHVHSITATLVLVCSSLLSHQEAGLSEAAWRLLGEPEDGTEAHFRHAVPVESMSSVRGKLYGQKFTTSSAAAVIDDIRAGRYSDIQLAAYVTACAGDRLDASETIAITQAMVNVGERFEWGVDEVLDKHCVGGLPGNRTTPIVVAIVTAHGLTMPKTSSRAITSPAGTADTMEVMTTVTLTFEQMKNVVAEQGGCLTWGGSVSLSPADDLIIRVERALDLDSEGQLVASVISKKVAAGSKKVLLDIPVGPTAKVRSHEKATRLQHLLETTGEALGLEVTTVISDGSQPIGRGIGPALEARDVLQVLRNEQSAPGDLREKSLMLAGLLLEMGGVANSGQGKSLALDTLGSGRAYTKFIQICDAQGGFSEPTQATYRHCVRAYRSGVIAYINNRFIARLASLAGAPTAPMAGMELHVSLGDDVNEGDPLFTLCAEAPGELEYAIDFLDGHLEVIRIEGDWV
jgi:thymidine phosphorylase